MIYYNYLILFCFLMYDIYLFRSIYNSCGNKYPPFVPAPRHALKIIIRELDLIMKNAPRRLQITDPGCGIGTILLPLAAKHPEHNFTGIEWSKVLYKTCLLRGQHLANLTFFHQDMLEFDYSSADIIVCFLIPNFVPALQKHIIATARPGTLIYSIDCSFPQLNETDCFNSRLFWIKFKVHCYRL